MSMVWTVADSRVETLSLMLPIFHGRFLLTPGFFPENEEISAPPPCRLLIGIYLFYENWSTETFGKESSKRGVLLSLRQLCEVTIMERN